MALRLGVRGGRECRESGTSSASYPFCTGGSQVLDTAGRVEEFRRRYGTGETSAS